MHADVGEEPSGRRKGLSGGLLATNELDQRQQVDRIERMGDQEALGVRHVTLQLARHEPRRARGDDDVRRCMSAHLGEHALLQLQLLGNVLLYEVHLCGHRVQVGGKGQLALGRQRRQGQVRQGAFCVIHGATDPGLHFGLNVSGDHVDAEVQRPGGPPATDDSRAQKTERLHFSHDLRVPVISPRPTHRSTPGHAAFL